MAAAEVSNPLKEACIDTLRSLLSANQDVRKEAETQVQALEVTEGISNYYLKKNNINCVINV